MAKRSAIVKGERSVAAPKQATPRRTSGSSQSAIVSGPRQRPEQKAAPAPAQSGAETWDVRKFSELEAKIAAAGGGGGGGGGPHTHPIGDITGLSAALDGKADDGEITALNAALAGKANTSHAHAIADTTGLQTALDGKAAASHVHEVCQSLTPYEFDLPSSAFPALQKIGGRPVLSFDDTTAESAFLTGFAPNQTITTIVLELWYMMASAVANAVRWSVLVEAITSGDATDLDAGTSFDAANAVNDMVPGTAGYARKVSLTLTNKDAIAAGDYYRLQIQRDAANGGDTATGDAHLLGVQVRFQ